MSKVYHLTVCFLSLLAIGCAPPAPAPTPLAPFNAEEVKWSLGTGTAIVEGQAFLKTRGGDVKYGAGNTVYLVPNTPHTFDWFTRVTANLKTAPELDPAINNVTRKTVASGDGRFKFEGVPAGPYIVVTTVQWGAPVGYRGSLVTQGGFVGAVVAAETGKTTTVIVTH